MFIFYKCFFGSGRRMQLRQPHSKQITAKRKNHREGPEKAKRDRCSWITRALANRSGVRSASLSLNCGRPGNPCDKEKEGVHHYVKRHPMQPVTVAERRNQKDYCPHDVKRKLYKEDSKQSASPLGSLRVT